jgi:hypothetical protein
MVDRSNQEQQIREAMEACRPGHDDVEAPEIAHLAAEMVASHDLEERFARLQQTDEVLADAIRDVPVPEGLADRLLAALPAAAKPVASPDRQGVGESVVVPASNSARRRARPWWFAVAGVVAAMVLVAVSVWQSGRSSPWTASTVLEEAISRYSNENQDSGRLMSEASPPWGLPLSSAVRSSAGTRWRQIAGFLDRKGVAYDLTSVRGSRATLFVVNRTIAGLPDEPPSRPSPGTGNCTAAAWQQGSLLYVLVVQGDSSAYAEFLDLPRGPVT